MTNSGTSTTLASSDGVQYNPEEIDYTARVLKLSILPLILEGRSMGNPLQATYASLGGI